MFVWHNLDKCKPKCSGFYFVKSGTSKVHIAYYDTMLEDFVFFDEFNNMLMLFCPDESFSWAKMPLFSRSKLIDKGYVYL